MDTIILRNALGHFPDTQLNTKTGVDIHGDLEHSWNFPPKNKVCPTPSLEFPDG